MRSTVKDVYMSIVRSHCPKGSRARTMFAVCCMLLSGGLWCSPAIASIAWQGDLYNLHFMGNGTVLVYTTGSRTTAPSCSTVVQRFALDSTTPGGKSQLAGLLAANAAGRKVVIVGADNCSVFGDSETIAYFYFADQ